MQTSSDNSGYGIVGVMILMANLMLLATWPWLRDAPLGADAGEDLFEFRKGQRFISAPAVMRNMVYYDAVAGTVRRHQGVVFLGTSESRGPSNLPAQLNSIVPGDPTGFLIARGGISLIHSCVLFAQCAAAEVEQPPLVLLINPVYLTNSHDVINDGWLGSVIHTPVFFQMGHAGIKEHLTEGVLIAYRRHFGLRRLLYPFQFQEYLVGMLYLSFHQSPTRASELSELPILFFEFDGEVPEYDEARAVHVGYRASDELAKGRWEVKTIKECVCLEGLEASVQILKTQEAPVLLLLLPINRTFYAHGGLDMEVFDSRISRIRDKIKGYRTDGNIHVVDCFEIEGTDRGYKDRMHMDAYGFYQLAEKLSTMVDYRRFIEHVREYYSDYSEYESSDRP